MNYFKRLSIISGKIKQSAFSYFCPKKCTNNTDRIVLYIFPEKDGKGNQGTKSGKEYYLLSGFRNFRIMV